MKKSGWFLTALSLMVGMPLLGILGISLQIPDLGPERGMLSVSLPTGGKVYFKRETRGLNYDSLYLSSDPDPCKAENPELDYVFSGGGGSPIFYIIKENTLEIYSTGPVEKPSRDSFPVRIVYYALRPLEWPEVKESYQARGLTMLQVPITDGLCR